jgi:hypothetical protein
MTVPGLPLVLAEGVTSDQIRQLAAVMLGLVVFAAVFVLVERQRVRRDGDEVTPPPIEDRPVPPPVEYPPWTPPPPHTGAAPALSEGELQDELPVPFVPRGHRPANLAAAVNKPPPAAAPDAGPAAAARPKVKAPEVEPSKPATVEPAETAPPPLDHNPEGSPESPAEIGIIIPDEPGGQGKPGED